MLASAMAPSAAAEPPLSDGLQAYLRNCVHERLEREGHSRMPWFRIHLYLRLGDAPSAAAVDRDLRQHSGGERQGLIALFGQLAPDLTIHTAMARQLHLMHGCDRQLHLVTPPSESQPTLLNLGGHRYEVLTSHDQADCLHRIMPCPMLIFCPVGD